MVDAQNAKLVAITPPEAIRNNSSWATTSIDCRGFDYCTIYLLLGATDIALTALKVQESDDDGVADAYADVTGLRFGTDNNIGGSASTLPSATDDNKIFAFEVDLRGRKRYLDLVATIGAGVTGGFVAAWAELTRAEEVPNTQAKRGCSQILRK